MKQVYVVMIIQGKSQAYRSETIHSIHDSLEGAEAEARELEYQLPPDFEIDVEAFDIKTEEDYFDDHGEE